MLHHHSETPRGTSTLARLRAKLGQDSNPHTLIFVGAHLPLMLSYALPVPGLLLLHLRPQSSAHVASRLSPRASLRCVPCGV